MENFQPMEVEDDAIDITHWFRYDLECFGCLIVELSTFSFVNYCQSPSWTHNQRLELARFNARKYRDKIPL